MPPALQYQPALEGKLVERQQTFSMCPNTLNIGHAGRNYKLLVPGVRKHIEHKSRLRHEMQCTGTACPAAIQVLIACGGAGGDSCGGRSNTKPAACRHWPSTGPCPKGVGLSFRARYRREGAKGNMERKQKQVIFGKLGLAEELHEKRPASPVASSASEKKSALSIFRGGARRATSASATALGYESVGRMTSVAGLATHVGTFMRCLSVPEVRPARRRAGFGGARSRY